MIITEDGNLNFFDGEDSIIFIDDTENKYNYFSSLSMNKFTLYRNESTPYWERTPEGECELLRLTELNYDYPEQLKSFMGTKCPKELFYWGNLSLLKKQAVMVCGARNASKIGLDLAYKCGKLIAEQNFTLASGYARGVDIAAHLGALEAGGDTIAILPYGLLNFRLNREMREGFDLERLLVVSELQPSCRFTIRNAFRRNKLLVALSEAVIVVEPGETGGTWFSAQYASKIGKPLYFIEGMRPNIIPKLESMGGQRIVVNDGTPDLRKVYERE